MTIQSQQKRFQSMLKKMTLYTLVFFASINTIHAGKDEVASAEAPIVSYISVGDAETYIKSMEEIYLRNHSWTLAKMLDFFSDKDGNYAADFMIQYLGNNKDNTILYLDDAFYALCHTANAIAVDNMERRPETRQDLGQFVEDNKKLIASFEALFN